MKKETLLELLTHLPLDSTQAVVRGVKMKIIDPATQKKLIDSDLHDTKYHECILANGTFVFSTQNNELKELYKVVSK